MANEFPNDLVSTSGEGMFPGECDIHLSRLWRSLKWDELPTLLLLYSTATRTPQQSRAFLSKCQLAPA